MAALVNFTQTYKELTQILKPIQRIKDKGTLTNLVYEVSIILAIKPDKHLSLHIQREHAQKEK